MNSLLQTTLVKTNKPVLSGRCTNDDIYNCGFWVRHNCPVMTNEDSGIPLDRFAQGKGGGTF